MKITKKILEQLLKLSGLKTKDEKEKEILIKQISETLVYFENLEEIDTSKVKPAYFSSDDNKNQFFLDGEKNKRGLKREGALRLSQYKDKKYFKVKRII